MDAQVDGNRIQTRNLREESKERMVLVPMPEVLTLELTRMRRKPQDFTVYYGAKCKLCYKRVAFDVKHANGTGSWCPEHGWLQFDSVAIPPTERLKPYEIEERKEAERRKVAWQKRQKAGGSIA